MLTAPSPPPVLSQLLNVPITALVYTFSGCLLAAKSSHVYTPNPPFLLRVFKHQAIHHLVTHHPYDKEEEEQEVVVAGGRSIAMVTVSSDNHITIKVPEVRLQDWVVQLEGVGNRGLYACLFSYNTVALLDNDLTVLQVKKCSTCCIVYGGYVFGGVDAQHVTAYSGTVFNEILCWKPFSSSQGDVILRYKGHNGVIFGVDGTDTRLVSVSDDRSLIVWERATAVMLHKLYYHSARVLKVLVLPGPGVVVTGGEDSRVVVWDMEGGQVIREYHGHNGNSGVRSLAYHQPSSSAVYLATGGWDGQIFQHCPLLQGYRNSYNMEDCVRYTTPAATNAAPRWVCCVGGGCFVVCFASGILALVQPGHPMEILDNDERFKGYSVFCKTNGIVVIGGVQGHLAFFNIKQRRITYRTCPRDGRIFSLTPISKLTSEGTETPQQGGRFMVCQDKGHVTLWRLTDKDGAEETTSTLTLPPLKNRWVVCGATVSTDKDYLVLGDRKGGVHLYSFTKDTPSALPLTSYHGLHGSQGVTQFLYHHGKFSSIGNDGNLRHYAIREGQLHIIGRFKPVPSSSWLQRIEHTGNTTLVHYFHGQDYLIRNLEVGEVVLRVDCGGAHRSWDIEINPEYTAFGFVFINTSIVYGLPPTTPMHLTPLRTYGDTSHSSEIHCVTVTGTGDIITGGEDGDVICRWGEGDGPVSRYSSHISAVRALSVVGDVLFSGGGKASLKAWRIVQRWEKNQMERETRKPGSARDLELITDYNVLTDVHLPVGYTSSYRSTLDTGHDQKITSLFAYPSNPRDNAEEENVTSLIVGLSSGGVKELEHTTSAFRLVRSYSFDNCITCVQGVSWREGKNGAAAEGEEMTKVTAVATTFGHLHLIVHGSVTTVRCHDSGINGIDMVRGRTGDGTINVTIATVGDDGAVMVTVYNVLNNTISTLLSRRTVHFSAGIGVRFLQPSSSSCYHGKEDSNQLALSPLTLVTVGSDQRVVVIDPARAAPLSSYFTDVSDPHFLTLINISQGRTAPRAMVCGKGLQILPLFTT